MTIHKEFCLIKNLPSKTQWEKSLAKEKQYNIHKCDFLR